MFHHRSTMRIGTDAVLFAQWVDVKPSDVVLDIGTGSGLIAIMAAQRCNAHVTGIEIDSNAAAQAKKNADNCPWSERIEVINTDILKYQAGEPFDTIVSNPPYFVNSLKCGTESRTLARHSDTLDCNSFFRKADELLTKEGKISIVIPTDLFEEWKDAAALCGFCPSRVTYIKTTPRKAPKRVLVEFIRAFRCNTITSTLVLEDSPGVYSKEAQEILRDFYLKIM